jgi:hypothetical protein
MKKAALLLFTLLCAVPTFAQVSYLPVTVQFPHIVVGGDPGGLNYVTVVQAVNNNSTFSVVHIALFSDSGAPMSASFDGGTPASFVDFNLDSGATRQIAISSTGSIAGGWMSIIYNNSDAATTVVIQYRAGTSVLTEVGINPFYNELPFSDFAVETGANLNAGIAIANPNAAAASVLVSLWDPSTGNLLASTPVSLPANGHIAKFLTELFPNAANISQIRTQVSLDSCLTSACTADGGPGFIATVLRFNLTSSSFTTIPVIQSPQGGPLVRVLPQVAVGGDPNGINFQTILYLTTGAPSGVTGVANFFGDNGSPINVSANGGAPSSSFTFTVLSNRVTRIVLSSSNPVVQVGWVQLILPQNEPLIVNAVYQTLNGPNVASETGVLESPPTSVGLIYANLQAGVENVGLAFANTLSNSNNVTLTLYDQAGFVADTQTVTLPPMGHLARFVTELFPSLANATTFDGSVSIQDSLGVSVVALRVTGTNFATIPVAQTTMFVPSVTNVSVTSTSRANGGTVTFTINVSDFTVPQTLVTPTSTAATVGAGVLYSNGFDGYYAILVDGSNLVNSPSGTLTGTFTGTNTSIASGAKATFFVFVQDSLGNPSNTAFVPISFK